MRNVLGPSLLALVLLLGPCAPARAAEIDFERLANAIYRAEGGPNTAHPYGILAHYKHTTPRQACLNTISRRFKAWDGDGDFIRYLGQYYAPVGALNDPTGLNRNWVRNVETLYNKGV